MRKLSLLFAIVSLVFAGVANAGIADKPNSVLSAQIGGNSVSVISLPSLNFATLTDDGTGGHILNDDPSFWVADGLAFGSSLYTGVPLVTDLMLTVRNKAGVFVEGFTQPTTPAPSLIFSCMTGLQASCLGGIEGLDGQVVIKVGFGPGVPVPLGFVGVIKGAMTTVPLIGGASIVATGAAWSTGWVQITNLTTNIIVVNGTQTGVAFSLEPASPTSTVKTLTTLGGFRETMPTGLPQTQMTVTAHGTNSLGSASKPGMVTLISPIRIQTGNVAGTVPGLAKKKFVFIPEPGTLLLLISGAAGLVAVGRRRMRK